MLYTLQLMHHVVVNITEYVRTDIFPQHVNFYSFKESDFVSIDKLLWCKRIKTLLHEKNRLQAVRVTLLYHTTLLLIHFLSEHTCK